MNIPLLFGDALIMVDVQNDFHRLERGRPLPDAPSGIVLASSRQAPRHSPRKLLRSIGQRGKYQGLSRFQNDAPYPLSHAPTIIAARTVTPSATSSPMRRLTLFVSAFLLFCIATHSPAKAEVADRIVAVVNDDVITLSELNEEGSGYFQALIKEVPTDKLQSEMQKMRQEVLSHLIDQRLIEQQAAKLEIIISEQEVDQTLNTMLAENHATKETLAKDLAAKGITVEQYRHQIRSKMLQARVINRDIRSRIVVNDEMVNQFYKENYANQAGAGSGYHILQMGFLWGDKYKQKTAAEARQAAEAAKKELASGKSFAEVAHALSDLPSKEDGGDIGIFQAKELAPSMKSTVLAMKAGETSGIIETKNGFQIIKLLSTPDGGQPAGGTPSAEIKKEIEEKLYNQEGEELFKKWITDLRTKAFIKQNL